MVIGETQKKRPGWARKDLSKATVSVEGKPHLGGQGALELKLCTHLSQSHWAEKRLGISTMLPAIIGWKWTARGSRYHCLSNQEKFSRSLTDGRQGVDYCG